MKIMDALNHGLRRFLYKFLVLLLFLICTVYSVSAAITAENDRAPKLTYVAQPSPQKIIHKGNHYCHNNSNTTAKIYCYWYGLLSPEILRQYANSQKNFVFQSQGTQLTLSYIVKQNNSSMIDITLHFTDHNKQELSQTVVIQDINLTSLEQIFQNAVLVDAVANLDFALEIPQDVFYQLLPFDGVMADHQRIDYLSQVKLTANLHQNQIHATWVMNIASLGIIEAGIRAHVAPPLWSSVILNALSDSLLFPIDKNLLKTNEVYFDSGFFRYKDLGLIDQLLTQYTKLSPLFNFMALDLLAQHLHTQTLQQRNQEKRRFYRALATYFSTLGTFEVNVETKYDATQTRKLWFALWQLISLQGLLANSVERLNKTHASQAQLTHSELMRIEKKYLNQLQSLLQNNLQLHYNIYPSP